MNKRISQCPDCATSDSYNYMIMAVSVTAELIVTVFHIPLLDTMGGLAVASLIIKSIFDLG